MASATQMSPADARTAIFNATVEMLKLNEKVGNSLPAEIVQCVDGKAVVNADSQVVAFTGPMSAAGQGGGARRTRGHRRVHRRKTHIRRHK